MSHDPFDYSLGRYLLFIGIGALGGLTHRLQHLSKGASHIHCWRCFLLALVSDLCTSGFAALLMFWACESMGLSGIVTAVCCGMSGHMGARLLFIAENLLLIRITAIAKGGDDENNKGGS